MTSLDPSTKSTPVRVAGGTGVQGGGRLSPNGRWLTYASTESGRSEVYVVGYPIQPTNPRQQVTPSGGTFADWAADGRTIYFASRDRLWRVTFNPQSGEIGKPELLPKVLPGFDWSVGPDGRFLISKLAKGSEHRSLKVILNWTQTLRDISRQTK